MWRGGSGGEMSAWRCLRAGWDIVTKGDASVTSRAIQISEPGALGRLKRMKGSRQPRRYRERILFQILANVSLRLGADGRHDLCWCLADVFESQRAHVARQAFEITNGGVSTENASPARFLKRGPIAVQITAPSQCPGAVLDACLQLGFLDDPAEVVGVAGGDLVVASAAVLPEMKLRVERGCGSASKK